MFELGVRAPGGAGFEFPLLSFYPSKPLLKFEETSKRRAIFNLSLVCVLSSSLSGRKPDGKMEPPAPRPGGRRRRARGRSSLAAAVAKTTAGGVPEPVPRTPVGPNSNRCLSTPAARQRGSYSDKYESEQLLHPPCRSRHCQGFLEAAPGRSSAKPPTATNGRPCAPCARRAWP